MSLQTSSSLSSNKPQTPVQFSILNYNVNFVYTRDGLGDSNSMMVYKAILESGADLVCLQETHQGYEQFLLNYNNQELARLYPYHVFYTHGGSGGMALLSKFEFVENSEECLTLRENGVEGSWFPMHLNRVRVPIGKHSTLNHSTEFVEIQLVNIHLRPPLNDDGSATLWTAYMTNQYRLNEVQYLVSHFEKKKILQSSTEPLTSGDHTKIFKQPRIPIIMLGDYNEHDHDPALTFLTKECLYRNESTETLTPLFRDALNEFVPQTRETHRWPLKFLWGKITYWSYKRLDHCVYSVNNLKCTSCKVMDGYEDNASDHQPVLSTFALEFFQ
ncbi:hypothetical protein C9374_002510 [Naegleria lovaniensis]|uniref:Endonuclease/exonuclease/phosphatase domain-containing protein n=1 Tax=Naegleria lovaniensis TaxID=51637 RepID=A0AA88GVS4_NAELO|nr:uncharacterized protein C9374_002510 [Naegleria lovaniensis]KAG2386766.1 hypothetical protein C9374_002510 [Naegleria lovaniensis]